MSNNTNGGGGQYLTTIAKDAIEKYPTSDIEVALAFVSKVCVAFVKESNDRLVKVGRSIRNLFQLYNSNNDGAATTLEQSLALVQQECELIVSGKLRVPTVPFGETGIAMPIVTLGCMRFQQEWGPRISTMNMVYSDCQDNLVAILRYSLQLGMNHIETARGYGCSELQIGTALQQLYLAGEYRREDIILQTKVIPFANPLDFKSSLETSFRLLQTDYIDLFSFHGVNLPEHYDYIFGKTSIPDCPYDNCYQVIEEYRKDGKVRHVGFTTHAPTELTIQLINTDKFEYCNLHYHYFGSYTASGGYDTNGLGNWNAVKLLHEKNMGIFIISPFDKGGRLYAPSNKVRSLTLPEMEPMSFMSNWIWNHHQLRSHNGESYQLHTYTVGAGRPSDLDQPAVAAYLHGTENSSVVSKLSTVVQRLDQEQVKVLGEDWVKNWWKGIPKSDACPSLVEHNQILWMYNSIKSFGLYEFAKARYNSLEKNYYGKWDAKLSDRENIINVGIIGWGYVPGLPLLPNKDYSIDLQNVPVEHRVKIIEAELFVYNWCRDRTSYDHINDKASQNIGENGTGTNNGSENGASSNGHHNKKSKVVSRPLYSTLVTNDDDIKAIDAAASVEEEKDYKNIPFEWQTAYDMRPWPDYPDQAKRN